MSDNLTDRFFAKGREFLGSKYPILGGAMSWVSNPKLVASISNAGGFGCLAGGNTPVEIFEQQIEETKSLTDKPFAVNLVTVAPAYGPQLEVIQKHKPEVVIFAGGLPKKEEIQLAKACGAKAICFAASLPFAKKMIRAGADALILEGMEAGGHIGHVVLNVLLQEILFNIDSVPVFVAGGISSGKLAAHLMMMGAAGVQLGTRFAIAAESPACEDFRKAFCRANSRDAIAAGQIDSRLPVIGVRALRNKGQDEFTKLQVELIEKLNRGEVEREAAQLELESFWMGGLRRAVMDGDMEFGSIMAGQSVGLVKKSETCQEIIDDLVSDMTAEFQRTRDNLI